MPISNTVVAVYAKKGLKQVKLGDATTDSVGYSSLKITPQTPGTEMNVYKASRLNKVLLKVYADRNFGSSAYIPIPLPEKPKGVALSLLDNIGTVTGTGKAGSRIRL